MFLGRRLRRAGWTGGRRIESIAQVDLEAQIPSGHTALMLSAQNGHDQCACALIEAGANIEPEATEEGDWTALKCSVPRTAMICAPAHSRRVQRLTALLINCCT